VGDWVEKKLGVNLVKDYMLDVLNLLRSSSREFYFESLKECYQKWDPRFLNYYKTFADQDVQSSFRPVLEELDIYNILSGVTNNPAESTNAAFKNIVSKKDVGLFQAVYSWYFYQIYAMAEIVRGFNKQGEFRLNSNGQLEKIYLPKNLQNEVHQSAISAMVFEGHLPIQFETNEEYKGPSLPETTLLPGVADLLCYQKRVFPLPEANIFVVDGLCGKKFIVSTLGFLNHYNTLKLKGNLSHFFYNLGWSKQ